MTSQVCLVPLSAAPEAPASLCQGKRRKHPTGNLPGAAASAASAPAGAEGLGGTLLDHGQHTRAGPELLSTFPSSHTSYLKSTVKKTKQHKTTYLEFPAAASSKHFHVLKLTYHPGLGHVPRYNDVRIPLYSSQEPQGRKQNAALHQQQTHFSCCLQPCQ